MCKGGRPIKQSVLTPKKPTLPFTTLIYPATGLHESNQQIQPQFNYQSIQYEMHYPIISLRPVRQVVWQ